FLSTSAHPKYLVTGQPEAHICSGLVIQSCEVKPVTAVKKDGKVYSFASQFDKVSEYSPGQGRCWIVTSGGEVVASLVRRLINRTTFLTTENGVYKELKTPDSVTFECVKR